MRSLSPDPTVVLLGSYDTKPGELDFLRSQVVRRGARCEFLDTGLDRDSTTTKPNGNQKTGLMLRKAEEVTDEIRRRFPSLERTAILGIGGGVGSWIALSVMRRLPFGVGKVLLSTLPFDPRAEMKGTDVIIIPSVTDIQGLNPILRVSLRKAACIAVQLAVEDWCEEGDRPVIGITGLGITTPAVKHCQALLEGKGYEVATFHATGFGTCAFERLIEKRTFRGIIDLTTYEMHGFLFGGVAIPEQERLSTAGRCGVPQIICPGGLDILGRGPINTLSAEERLRPHYCHSPMFTHVRSSQTQMRATAKLMAHRLQNAKGPTCLMIPLGGFSDADRVGSAMWDSEANSAFIETIRQELRTTFQIIEVNAHINEPAFSEAVVRQLLNFLQS